MPVVVQQLQQQQRTHRVRMNELVRPLPKPVAPFLGEFDEELSSWKVPIVGLAVVALVLVVAPT